MNEVRTARDTDDEPTETQTGSAVPPIRATDAERLMRFWRRRDEAALAELIEQHAGMVWGVCSQILRHREDVEDAFQATFLILARKARTIRTADSAAGWLYRVAFRTALLARSRRQRMLAEPLHSEPSGEFDQLEEISRNEQCRLLLEELNSLPLQYRQPLVLCYLEGRTRSEAAEELGITPQSVKGRLARGTRMLRSRLVSRGAALSTTMATLTAAMATTQAATPPALVLNTAALGAGFALKLAGAGATAAAAKGGAAILAEKGILSMTLIAAAKPAVAVLGVFLTAGMLAVASADAPEAGGGGKDNLLSAAITLLAGEDEEANAVEVTAELAPTTGEAPAEERRGELRLSNSPASGKEDLFAPPAVITLMPPAAPAVPGAPQAISVTASSDSPSAQVAGNKWQLVPGAAAQLTKPQPIEPFNLSFRQPTAPVGVNEQTLRLQGEYWSLKSNGLKKKAEALTAKAEYLRQAEAPKADLLEAEAEAELTLAEVKLCEISTLQIGEQLTAIEASRLKIGSKGVQVNMLQQALNDRLEPSPGLDVDGDFGPLTEEAVKLFQKNNGLKETGVVDDKTGAALGLPLGGGADVLKPNFIYSNSSSFELPLQAPTAVRLPLEASKLKERRLLEKTPAEAFAAAAAGGGGQGGKAVVEMRLAEEQQLTGAKLQMMAKEQQLKALRSAVDELQQRIKSLEERPEEKPTK